jgi:hypothetical protein
MPGFTAMADDMHPDRPVRLLMRPLQVVSGDVLQHLVGGDQLGTAAFSRVPKPESTALEKSLPAPCQSAPRPGKSGGVPVNRKIL